MKYTQEEKERAVALAVKTNPNAASKELGISYATVKKWVDASNENDPAGFQTEVENPLEVTELPEQVIYDHDDNSPACTPDAPSQISAEERVRMLERENADLQQIVQRLKNAINALIS